MIRLLLACALAAGLALAWRRLPRGRFWAAALFAVAGGLLLARQGALAAPVAAAAYALWRRGGVRGSGPATSAVRSRGLAMELDHGTGAMDGTVLEGPLAGRRLSELGLRDLDGLAAQFAGDADSLNLLLAYLDRRREEAPEAGQAAPGAPPAGGPMSEAEAYGVLGLEPGASRAEVRAAYRRLIRRVHPDLGGTGALAALLNAARARLDPEGPS